MRTAEEILSTVEGNSIWGELLKGRGDVYYEDDVKRLINEARIEAIKECAELVPICHVIEGQCGYDRKEILSLIEQVK